MNKDKEQMNVVADIVAKGTSGVWTAEPHGNTTALYAGRGENQHGLRLMNLDDGDAKFQENVDALLSATNNFLELHRLYLQSISEAEDLTNRLGQSELSRGELAGWLSKLDAELSSVITRLWERSSQEEREAIALEYPSWEQGKNSVFIIWDNKDGTTEST